jgi:hypothetical protein
MSYTIVINRTEKDVPYTSEVWQKLRDDASKDPSGNNENYGYVTTDGVKTVETPIFEQVVEELDMKAVVAVINNINVEETK